MAKSGMYISGLMLLKTLEYLHNLPEPPLGETQVQVRTTDIANYLTSLNLMPKVTIPRDTAKKILNSIADSNTGYLLERKKSNGDQDEYWYRRSFTIEQISLLSTIISSSMFLSEQQIIDLLVQLGALTSKENATKLSSADHFLRPRMMNAEALENLRKIHEAINNKQALRFYIGGFDTDKHVYYDKPVRGKTKEFERITFSDPQTKQIFTKSFPEQGAPIICYPYALVWDNSRCYLICGVEKDDHIHLWNYRVDRMFELKPYAKAGYREPKSSPYYKNMEIDAERYLHSVFKMFTNNERLSMVTLQFKKKLTRVIVEKFGFDVQIESIDELYAKTTVEVQISQQFYGWLAGFRAVDLRMISPELEVEKYIKYLTDTIDIYNPNKEDDGRTPNDE